MRSAVAANGFAHCLRFAAGGATGKIDAEHVDLAVIVELIHLATLVHDDIMDEAEQRRAQPTVNARWGNSLSVLVRRLPFRACFESGHEFRKLRISVARSRERRARFARAKSFKRSADSISSDA